MVCTKVSLRKNKKLVELNDLKKQLKAIKSQKNNYIINRQYNEALKLKSDELNLESRINILSLDIKKKKKKIIRILDVKEVIENKAKIPIYDIKDNRNKINMEKYLKKKIIGQDKVIENVSRIMQKIMLGLKNNRPYSFLLVGRSGVGKTMLVKEYSEFLKIPLIRLDMSEYKESNAISKIIGSPPGYVGYNDVDTVLEKVKTNPYCIILLDEIEKACSEVINLFLQILDEGIITDSHGNKVNMKNTIIFMTSNIGSERENIGFNNQEKKEMEIRNILSTALVNRINNICYFNNLNEDNIVLILEKKVKEIKKEYQNKGITFVFDKKIINYIVNNCEYEIYGVRKAIKMLEEKIDDIVINNIFNNKKIKVNKI